MSSSPNSSFSSDAIQPLGDVLCSVDVLIGTATISVRECLRLARQKVIRLNEIAGADVRVTVNGVAVANGEVVIVDDTTAVRVTDILEPPSAESAS